MIASGIRLVIVSCLVTFAASCLDTETAGSINATEDTSAKIRVIERSLSKKLNELSETERKEFIEELTSDFKRIELANIIKDECYEKKGIEDDSNCLEMRAKCTNLIKMDTDLRLSEFYKKLPESNSCLNKQFTQSNILLDDVVSLVKLFIDFMETMNNELDCPASLEQFGNIAEKIRERHGEKISGYKSEVDDLFYQCLHKHILR